MTTRYVRHAALAVAALVLAGCSDSPTLPTTNLNLGFEEAYYNAPVGWLRGGLSAFEVEVDEETVRGGRFSLRIHNLGSGDFGTTLRLIEPGHVRGKTVRLSGWIRTSEVGATPTRTDPWAGLWMRVDTPDGNGEGGFDNMADRGPSGTTGWQQFVIEMDVPSNANEVTIGTMLVGGGTAWFDDLQITVDGREYGAG